MELEAQLEASLAKWMTKVVMQIKKIQKTGDTKVIPSKLGSFKIFVIKAKLDRDVESFGQMDPYVKVTYESKSYKTHI